MTRPPPLRIVNAVAPIRVCDNGGWTDTWFARHGKVFNIAVSPYAEVQVRVSAHEERAPRITLEAANYGQWYQVVRESGSYGPHPLLEAAIESMPLPEHVALEVSVSCQAPAGCGTGTSAAVCVALLGALDALTPGRMASHEVARAAQRVEAERLRQQVGVQDQLAAAFGGVNYIEITDYPNATVSPLVVPDPVWWELEARLALVYVGQAHHSSAIHELVIRELEDAGPGAEKLRPLRRTAEASREALYAADFEALGRAMVENTEAQASLHPALVGPDHQAIIAVARAHGAAGWKVNGAGGAGGSVTILGGPDASARRVMLRAIQETNAKFQVIPIRLSRSGLRVWETPRGS